MHPFSFKCSYLLLLVAFLVWSSLAEELSLHKQKAATDEDADVSTSTSTSLASSPPQSQCWVDALKIFQPTNQDDVQGSTKLCEVIGHHQKKALAFELARCHLQDLGRPIIDSHRDEDVEDPHNCTVSTTYTNNEDSDQEGMESGQFFPNLSKCLSYLTDAGANAYTQFFAQVVQLCNRLTQHMAIDIQQHAALQLAKITHQTAAQIKKILQKQEDNFSYREEAMRNRYEDFYHAMKQRQEKLWENQTRHIDDIQSWTSYFVKHWKKRDQEQKAQHAAWLYNQTIFLQERTSALKRQHEEMQNLHEKVSATTNMMQPLVNIELLVLRATQGFTLFTSLLHLLAALSVTWLLTWPRRCQRNRGYLFTAVIMEALIELCVHFGIGTESVSSADQTALISAIRSTALGVETILYLSGLLASTCCCCRRREDDDEYGYLEDNDSEYSPSEDSRYGMEEEHIHKIVEESIKRVSLLNSQNRLDEQHLPTLPVQRCLHRRTSSEPMHSNEEAIPSTIKFNVGTSRDSRPWVSPVDPGNLFNVQQNRPNGVATIPTTLNSNRMSPAAPSYKHIPRVFQEPLPAVRVQKPSPVAEKVATSIDINTTTTPPPSVATGTKRGPDEMSSDDGESDDSDSSALAKKPRIEETTKPYPSGMDNGNRGAQESDSDSEYHDCEMGTA